MPLSRPEGEGAGSTGGGSGVGSACPSQPPVGMLLPPVEPEDAGRSFPKTGACHSWA